MRERLTRRGIGIIANIGFGDQIAGRVIGKTLGDIDTDGRGLQPIQRVISEVLAPASVEIGAAEQITVIVIAVTEVLDRTASTKLVFEL